MVTMVYVPRISLMRVRLCHPFIKKRHLTTHCTAIFLFSFNHELRVQKELAVY